MANHQSEDDETNIAADNDAPATDLWDTYDTEDCEDCPGIDSSDSHGEPTLRRRTLSPADLERDVKLWLSMIYRLKGMLRLSLSAAMPEHLLRASMVLSYSISTEIHARLPKPKYIPPRPARSTRLTRFSSKKSFREPRSMGPNAARDGRDNPPATSPETAESTSDDLNSDLDDFICSCEEQRLDVAHETIPSRGRIIRSADPRSDVIAFWDNGGSNLKSTMAPQLLRLYPRRNGESVNFLGKIPTLIRITSSMLLEELNNIMGVDLDLPHDGVFAAPFSALVFHTSRIQARMQWLRQSAMAVEQDLRLQSDSVSANPSSDRGANSSAPTVDVIEKKESAFPQVDQIQGGSGTPPRPPLSEKQKELRSELRSKVHLCLLVEGLVDFIKALVGPSLKVHRRIGNGTLESINFEQLWQLFPPGETLIYHKEGHNVACKVYNISGGRRISTSSEFRAKRLFSAPEDVASRTSADLSRPRDRGIPAYPGHLIRHVSSQPQTPPSSEEKQAPGSFAPLIVDCFMMDFNGTHVGPCHIGFQFDYFPGERPVRSLDIYPLRFHPKKDELSVRLRIRGRRVLDVLGHRTHNGMPLSGFDDICGQIYVDNAAGYRHIGWPEERLAFGTLNADMLESTEPHPMLQKPPIHLEQAIIWDTFSVIQSLKRTLLRFVRPETTALAEDFYLLMSYVVLGYAFQQRRWYYFDIDSVGSIDRSEEARLSGWKDLVIPSKFREMLVALVDSHASGMGRSALRKGRGLANQVDLVRGKGNGLIILLHGPPGTGKTSTAETIAAYTQRPLYSITCGDIGTTAEEVEFNLQKHFDLANQWGCVLCLDEADVFLTKRDWHDLNRNSLVSVWLRTLEYYSGILFITTNRIGVIDEAFKSRIHICLRYPSINLDSTKSIWNKILDRIEAENRVEPVKIEFDRDAVMGFAEKHYQRNEATGSTWNGRQIRNVVQTAISLGQYERLQRLRRKDMTEEDAERSGKPKYMRVELTRENLKSIAATATDFEHYITNVRGADASVARNESLRDDDYDGSGKKPQKSYSMLEVARAGPVPGMGIGFGAGTVVSGSSSGGWPASEDWGGVSETSYGMGGKGKKKTAVVEDDSDDSL